MNIDTVISNVALKTENKYKKIVDKILENYDISYQKITDVIDSSKRDYRLNIILDNKYIVRINEKNVVSEERLSDIERLIERYNEIGVYVPHYIKNKNNKYSVINLDKICYVGEYANLSLASELKLDEVSLTKEAIYHLGILASRFTNVDLIETKSMWSIIDLAPLDEGIDEKQENVNSLIDKLKSIGEGDLANRVSSFNNKNRDKIKTVFSLLPRCVYQGDLNDTNILIKDNHFYGLIDFNMSGTEVNINSFLAETNKNLDEDDLEKYSASELYDVMLNYQNELLELIFENYHLNKEEKEVFENYRNIILISQFPNVCTYIYGIDNGYKEKVLELIKIIIDR